MQQLWKRLDKIVCTNVNMLVIMCFEWDQAKNAINIHKHGIDFADAVDLFNYPLLTLKDNRDDYGEERWVAIGWLNTLMGVVIYTEPSDGVIRIISARKATKYEVRCYEQACKNEVETTH